MTAGHSRNETVPQRKAKSRAVSSNRACLESDMTTLRPTTPDMPACESCGLGCDRRNRAQSKPSTQIPRGRRREKLYANPGCGGGHLRMFSFMLDPPMFARTSRPRTGVFQMKSAACAALPYRSYRQVLIKRDGGFRPAAAPISALAGGEKRTARTLCLMPGNAA